MWTHHQEHQRGLSNEILEGKIWQQLLVFFFPLLLGTFFQTLYNTADMIIVGRYVGKVGLSAVGGTSGVIINLIVGFFVGMSTGATVIIAQCFGARKEKEISLAVHTTMAMAIVFGLIMMVLCALVAPHILVWMNTPGDIIGQSALYLRIYSLGMLPQMLYNMGTGVLRAIGDSRRPTLFLVAGIVSNIGLDLLFIVGFGQGVAGAAIATVLSQTISALLILHCLTHIQGVLRLSLRQIRLDGPMFHKIVSIGLPAGIRSSMYNLSNVIIQGRINGFGTDVVAAWSAWGKTDSVYWMVISSLGTATTTIAGQNYGAGRYERVRACTRQGLVLAVLLTLLFAVPIDLFVGTILRLFTTDPQVISIGVRIGTYLAPCFILWIGVEIFSAVLVGMGNAGIPTVITILGVCLLRILWNLFVVPRHYVLETVIFSYPMTWGVTSLAFLVYYLLYMHRRGFMGQRRAGGTA